MNNFNKKDNKIDSNQLIRYAAIKSKQQLENYYSKNKSKLPPILQSRNIFVQHLGQRQTDKIENLTRGVGEFRPQRPILLRQMQQEQQQTDRNHSAQLFPKLGKLIFDKDNPRKIRRQYLVSYSSIDRTRLNTLRNRQCDVNSHRQNEIHNRVKLRTSASDFEQQYNLLSLNRRIQSRKRILDEATNRSLCRRLAIIPQNNRVQSIPLNKIGYTVNSERNGIKSIFKNQESKRTKPERVLTMSNENHVDEISKKQRISSTNPIRIGFTIPRSQVKKYNSKLIRKMEQLEPWSQQQYQSDYINSIRRVK